MSLHQALQLLRQANYSAALKVLEAVCQSSESVNHHDRIRAQIALVRTYIVLQDFARAIEVCQALRQHPHPKVKQWAIAQLEKLAAPPLTSAAPANETVLAVAKQAIESGAWFTAIQTIEHHLAQANQHSGSVSTQYEMLLLEAYIGSQNWQAAQKLYHHLLSSDDPVVVAWAKPIGRKLPSRPSTSAVSKAAKRRKTRIAIAGKPSAEYSSTKTLSSKIGTWLWRLNVMVFIGFILLGKGYFQDHRNRWSTSDLQKLLSFQFVVNALDTTEPIAAKPVLVVPPGSKTNTDQWLELPQPIVQKVVKLLRSKKANSPILDKSKNKYTYYEIQGYTAQEVRQSIHNEAHFLISGVDNEQSNAVAYTRFHPNWVLETQTIGSSCWILKIKITAHADYTYPKWVNYDQGSLELKDAWDRYMRHLVRHEEHHTAIDMQAMAELQRQVLQTSGYPSCPEGYRAVYKLSRQLYATTRAKHKHFHETENDPDGYALRSLIHNELYRKYGM
ncbi:MAG: DUF922 domain-containing Zn-dependent protease [Spirulina sp. SIO3F2]|nr:DUF922 domain-containing Zn-dependent protease [Spirulina sp. SIO3F2]